MSTIDQALVDYREAVEKHASGHSQVTNRWHQKLHGCYKLLRETEEGRRGITSLMSDPMPHVQVWAAAHSLGWEPVLAKRTLEEIRDSDAPSSFDAKWTLKMYAVGRLSFDYE
jgi:hypothetical protein